MWLTEATVVQKRALLAACLGWMLDSMDIMLYSMVLAYMMRDLGRPHRARPGDDDEYSGLFVFHGS
jgi:hypothetical protein